jgi:hypothetical protein
MTGKGQTNPFPFYYTNTKQQQEEEQASTKQHRFDYLTF